MQSSPHLTAPDAHACASSGETRRVSLADMYPPGLDDFLDASEAASRAFVAYFRARESRERRAALVSLLAWSKRSGISPGAVFANGHGCPLLAFATPAAVVLTAAAIALILLGAPLSVPTAPGIAAELPMPAPGIAANHVAQLVAAGPITA